MTDQTEPRPALFISYSRQCIGFVDDLAHKLEKRGFRFWLDYCSLVPGRPWLEQIHRGLDESDLLLLVVSPESIGSKSVELEWRHYLERGKRVILVIFQAVPLPPELAPLEWIDFRGFYHLALARLVRLIERPAPPGRPAPQSGFKAPPVVWLAGLLSLITSVYSLFAAWTFLIPWALAPLPGRIFKRNFNLQHVQTALLTLSIGIFFTFGLALELGLINENADFDYAHYYSLSNLVLFSLFSQVFFVPLISLFLVAVLRSPWLQRWGRPEASLTKFANLYHLQVSEPEPVRFHIDHAPEDGRIARELEDELIKHGHSPAADIHAAEEVLVLISRYKTDTEADPEQKIVYPILVQKARIPEKLARVQWIDFRKGVRNLHAIAMLLPQPEKMLTALGVRPANSSQGYQPNIVLALVDFLIIMAMVNLGSFILYMLELGYLNLGLIFEREASHLVRLLSLDLLTLVLSVGLIYFMTRALTERRGRLASAGGQWLGWFGLLALSAWQVNLSAEIEMLFEKHGILPDALFGGLPFLFLVLGGLIVGVAALFRWRDLRRWFPARVKKRPPAGSAA